MHVARNQRSKLDIKSKPCIFLGYSGEEFGYKLWDILEENGVESRHSIYGRQDDSR